MDAYSYMCRGKVFANAQTGNILLFGIYMSERQWDMAIRYLIPVIAFVTGIGVADLVRMKIKEKSIFHWRQLSVLSEAVVLFVVCFIPQKFNLPANSLTSLACGIQVESFRKIHGNGIATRCVLETCAARHSRCVSIWARKEKSISKKGFYITELFFVL